MQEHLIPQDIVNYKFHIVGNLDLKQFGEVGLGVLIGFALFYSNINFLIKWPLIIISVSTGLVAAFIPIADRPLAHWIKTFAKIIYQPTKFYWKKKEKVPDYFLFEPKEKDIVLKVDEINYTPIRHLKMQQYITSLGQNDPTEDKLEIFSQSKIKNVLKEFGEVKIMSNLEIKKQIEKPTLSIKQVRTRQLQNELSVNQINLNNRLETKNNDISININLLDNIENKTTPSPLKNGFSVVKNINTQVFNEKNPTMDKINDKKTTDRHSFFKNFFGKKNIKPTLDNKQNDADKNQSVYQLAKNPNNNPLKINQEPPLNTKNYHAQVKNNEKAFSKNYSIQKDDGSLSIHRKTDPILTNKTFLNKNLIKKQINQNPTYPTKNIGERNQNQPFQRNDSSFFHKNTPSLNSKQTTPGLVQANAKIIHKNNQNQINASPIKKDELQSSNTNSIADKNIDLNQKTRQNNHTILTKTKFRNQTINSNLNKTTNKGFNMQLKTQSINQPPIQPKTSDTQTMNINSYQKQNSFGSQAQVKTNVFPHLNQNNIEANRRPMIKPPTTISFSSQNQPLQESKVSNLQEPKRPKEEGNQQAQPSLKKEEGFKRVFENSSEKNSIENSSKINQTNLMDNNLTKKASFFSSIFKKKQPNKQESQKSTSQTLSSHEEKLKEAEFIDKFPTQISKPNKIAGVVVDSDGKIINNALIKIINKQTNFPKSILKTNSFGVFITNNNLENGEYIIRTKSENRVFPDLVIRLEGKILNPISIKSN